MTRVLTLFNTSCIRATFCPAFRKGRYNSATDFYHVAGRAVRQTNMRIDILPSEILAMRLALLRILLGPGWLGPDWTGQGTAPARQDWPAMERCYGELVKRLLPGLQYLCGASVDLPTPAADGGVPPTSVQDVPVAFMDMLRGGLVASPSGIKTSCRITVEDLLYAVVPFLAWIYCLNDNRLQGMGGPASPPTPGPARCLVLLAGIPGAGKSVIATLLEQLAQILVCYPAVQSLGMDGWHLPNRVIQARTLKDESGEIVPLAGRKGSPESFDVQALARDMHSLVWDTTPSRLPVYDRRTHEPLPEAVAITAPIVLLEGNYVLMSGQGWERLSDLCSGAAWLDVPVELARRSIIDRHLAGGRTVEDAMLKWRQNDWLNALAALRSRDNADAMLYVNSARRIHFAHRRWVCGKHDTS
jgi:putative kinase